jgi:hypothetical protein
LTLAAFFGSIAFRGRSLTLGLFLAAIHPPEI